MNARVRALASGLALCPALGACLPAVNTPAPGASPSPTASATATPPVVKWPVPTWEEGDPADFDLDGAVLDEAGAYAESLGGQCLLVIRDGTLVYERYYNGALPEDTHKTWSIAKSFTSALVGIAVSRGEIGSVTDSAADYIPSWQATSHENITVANLLSNNSGLYWGLVSDYTWAAFSNDQTADALTLGHPDPPDTVWNYNNHAVQTLHPLLEAATGEDPELYARKHLWEPIGMGPDTTWARDDAGNPTMYASVAATCRDLARFGYLYLQRGQWNGRQVVPADHVAASTQPSQDLNRVYGYLWWVNGESPAINATGDPFEGRTMFPFAPDDMFSAQGLGQNFIDVIPSSNTIYVHVRPAPHEPLSNLITDFANTLNAMLTESEQKDHAAILETLLSADTR